MKYTPEAFREVWLSGIPVKEVANKFKCSVDTCYDRANRLNLPKRTNFIGKTHVTVGEKKPAPNFATISRRPPVAEKTKRELMEDLRQAVLNTK
jgi:hypothetical protein